MVMTLSGVGGILGCSRFITGTFREDYGEDALDADYQLSNLLSSVIRNALVSLTTS